MTFDFLDIGLPSLAASAYSTEFVRSKEMGDSGRFTYNQRRFITGTIECLGAV